MPRTGIVNLTRTWNNDDSGSTGCVTSGSCTPVIVFPAKSSEDSVYFYYTFPLSYRDTFEDDEDYVLNSAHLLLSWQYRLHLFWRHDVGINWRLGQAATLAQLETAISTIPVVSNANENQQRITSI